MQCPHCGKTGFINISNKRYCSNCGKAITTATTTALSDLRPAKSTPASANPKPASSLHGAQVGAPAAVLDLRSQPATVPSAPVATTIPSQPVAPSKPATEPQTIPVTVASPPAPATAPVPAPVPTAPKPPMAPARSGMIQKFTPHPTITTKPTPMPPVVESQVENLQKLAAQQEQPKSQALQETLKSVKPKRFNPTNIAAATAAIAIMAGYVWFQNYPKMALRVASQKAGFEATLPAYMPASYRQNGPAQYAPGEVRLTFASPSAENPLSITERKTAWDSDSLRENYIAKQTDNYLAVQGQGLTIYLYNDGQASWVNHGVWYNVEGTSKLSRDQILKIAYSL
jgi:hypothetical protein